MMRPVSLITPFLLLAVSTALLAQDPSPPAKEAPPEPPLMTSAPPDCQWTITYTPKVPEKDPATPEEVRNRKMRLRYTPTILSKHVYKSNGQVVVDINYEAGIKAQAWVVGGYLYELPFREGDSIKINSKGQGDFSEIYWVSADNFRGTVELKGAKVHLYETDTADSRPDPSQSARPNAGPSAEPAKAAAHTRAYIDAKTRLPVMVETGNIVMTYQYTGPAATFPTPDDRIKKIMRDTAAPKKR